MTGAASSAVTFLSVRPREGESDHSNFPRGKKGEEGSLLYVVCASGYFATRGLRKEGRTAAPPSPFPTHSPPPEPMQPNRHPRRGKKGEERREHSTSSSSSLSLILLILLHCRTPSFSPPPPSPACIASTRSGVGFALPPPPLSLHSIHWRHRPLLLHSSSSSIARSFAPLLLLQRRLLVALCPPPPTFPSLATTAVRGGEGRGGRSSSSSPCISFPPFFSLRGRGERLVSAKRSGKEKKRGENQLHLFFLLLLRREFPGRRGGEGEGKKRGSRRLRSSDV